MAERICPVCSVALMQRPVTSKYGATIVVDRCPACRGIWLDRNELYQIGARGAEEVAAAAEATEAGSSAPAKATHCPACGEVLMALEGIHRLPGVEHARYCNGCGGFWLEERDLIAFQRTREAKLASISEGERARLAQAALDAKAYDIFQDRSPGESPTERGGSEGDAAAAATIAGAALSALAPPMVGPLVMVGLGLAERIAPFLADLVAQNLEAAKDDGRALPKNPKIRGGPRNRR